MCKNGLLSNDANEIVQACHKEINDLKVEMVFFRNLSEDNKRITQKLKNELTLFRSLFAIICVIAIERLIRLWFFN